MNRVTHIGWAATALLAVLVIWNGVYSLISNHRTKDAQKRTNERLKEMEESNNQIANMQATVKAMSSDLHMIKQFLMDKNQ